MQTKSWNKVMILFSALFLQLSSALATPVATKVKVVKVSDGDTVRVTTEDGNNFPVRFFNIDTPELHFPTKGGGWHSQGKWGEDASDYLKSLIPQDGMVTLLMIERDKYGRTVGKLFNGKKDFSLELVRAGQAAPFLLCTPRGCDAEKLNLMNIQKITLACDSAQKEGKGIFNPEHTLLEMPYEFRSRLRGEAPKRWVGDVRSKNVYEPSDLKKVPICFRIFFDQKEDALNLGFTPIN